MALEMIKKLGEEYLARRAKETEQKAAADPASGEIKKFTFGELVEYAKQVDICCFMCKEYIEKVARGEGLSSAEEYHLFTCFSAQKNLHKGSGSSLF